MHPLYWYLRHFDVKGIEAHVGWINLMSYDLHRDSENTAGKQVLSHTNLPEIDCALDLVSVTGTLSIYLALLTDTQTSCSSNALALSLLASYSAWLL
jgi:GH18 family chitinase